MLEKNRTYRVLIAEDDPDDQLLISEAISQSACASEVSAVNNGAELVNLLSAERTESLHDVIILDINMPLLNGFATLDELRRRNLLDKYCIFVLSTSNEQSDRDMALDKGARGFYTKPVDFDELKRIVSEMCRQCSGKIQDEL